MPLDAEGHEGRQDTEAHVVKGIVGRPQNQIDVPTTGTRAEGDFKVLRS